MILEAAPLQVKPGQTEAFESAFREAQSIIASMPGYRSHELQRCLEREGHYLLLVRWDSVASHEEGFRKSPGYQQWKGRPSRKAPCCDGPDNHHRPWIFVPHFPDCCHWRSIGRKPLPLSPLRT